MPPADVRMLLDALAHTHVGLCLCDADDTIRFVNEAFRRTFLPHYRGEAVNFVDCLVEAMAAGQGIRLDSMPLPAFIQRVKTRRREKAQRFDFSVDCQDGSWWWVNDHKMSNGWILAVASDMSTIKHEELKLRHAHASATHAAQTDFLTGVANRRHGFEQAELTLATAGSPLALGVIDLDHFKRVNDTFGHAMGDRVLIAFAQGLCRGLRAGDQVSRIGGEEFMIVFPATTVATARTLLSGLLRRIPPLRIGGRDRLPIAASAGVAAAAPGMALRDVLAAADAALYVAKANGRDRVEACAALPYSRGWPAGLRAQMNVRSNKVASGGICREQRLSRDEHG